MNIRMRYDEYSIANDRTGGDSRRVFNFLNRVFDSMKMHALPLIVYITWNDGREEKGYSKVQRGGSPSELNLENMSAVQNA